MRKPTTPSKLGNLLFECVIKRGTTYSASVPRYPVEDGTYVSDNVLKRPMQMSLDVMVTDYPLTWKSYITGSNERVTNVRDTLLDMYYTGGLYTLTTPDNVYDNMAIEHLYFPEDNYRNGMEVTINLVQVNITNGDVKISNGYQFSGTSYTDSGTTDVLEVSDADATNYLDTTYSSTQLTTESQAAQLTSGTQTVQLGSGSETALLSSGTDMNLLTGGTETQLLTGGTETLQLTGGTETLQLTGGQQPRLTYGTHLYLYITGCAQAILFY